MSDALICDAVRTAVGRKNGSLSATRAEDVAADVLSAIVARNNVDPADLEDVAMGCVTQIDEQGFNIGRTAALAAGFPTSVCGTTLNRMCGSSLQTTNFQACAIIAGQADLVIGAGVEMMSRVLMGSDGRNGITERVTDNYAIIPQGFSAEMIAEQWKITREQLDEYSYQSHMRAEKARLAGHFDNEIIAIDTKDAEGNPVHFDHDETIRAQTTLEKMGTLKPAFKPDGVVTAGNSSQICDGAAAVLLASESAVAKHGLKPRARVIGTGLAGVDPTIMLTGNPTAMRRALKRANLTLDDMSVIEINEAFASVVLQAVSDLDLHDRMDDVNPNGGGISLGHPLGASGARIVATLLNELERRDARYGIASMCIGMGQAISTVIERV